MKSWICKISLTLLAITLGCGDDLQTYLKDHSHSLTEDERRELEEQRSYPALVDDLAEQEYEEPSFDLNDSSNNSRYRRYRAEYFSRWNSIKLRQDKLSQIDWYVNSIVKHKASYQAVERQTGIPWFWVGIVHGLEGGFNFKTHLHNGDPLRARTVQIPAGRPKNGNAPFSWLESALDAMRYKGYHSWGDWEVISVLAYAWELYNGFGYRGRIPSPYLWSYSNHYSKGKYVKDGKYDPNAVSKQAGAMAVLKRAIERGLVDLNGPNDTTPQLVGSTDRPELSRVLKEGVKGDDVVLLQMRLASFGLSGSFDGMFGSGTVMAVEQFQKRFGIKVDGVVGSKTWEQLWPGVGTIDRVLITKQAEDKILVSGFEGSRCFYSINSNDATKLISVLTLWNKADQLSSRQQLGVQCPGLEDSYDVKRREILERSVGESSILAKGVYRLKMALLGDDGVQMSVFEHSKLLEERAIGAPGELKTILNTYKTSEFIGLK